jgi:hypothetical protein
VDWLTFIAEIVGALAWPITLVLVLLWIRRPLFALLPNLKRLKWKEIDLDFSKEVSQLKEKVAAEAEAPESEGQHLETSYLIRLAQTAPSAAVVIIFGELEHEAIRTIARYAPKHGCRRI